MEEVAAGPLRRQEVLAVPAELPAAAVEVEAVVMPHLQPGELEELEGLEGLPGEEAAAAVQQQQQELPALELSARKEESLQQAPASATWIPRWAAASVGPSCQRVDWRAASRCRRPPGRRPSPPRHSTPQRTNRRRPLGGRATCAPAVLERRMARSSPLLAAGQAGRMDSWRASPSLPAGMLAQAHGFPPPPPPPGSD